MIENDTTNMQFKNSVYQNKATEFIRVVNIDATVSK